METPLQYAAALSSKLGNTMFLKREDLQPVKSFKLRGAYNKMAQLTPDQLARGVICSSAGNHAQGVALAASKLVRWQWGRGLRREVGEGGGRAVLSSGDAVRGRGPAHTLPARGLHAGGACKPP